MHDSEQKPSPEDSMGERTDAPPQEDQQIARSTDATPMTREPERPHQPVARRSLVAGGIVLLVFAVIFSAVLLHSQPSAQPGPGKAPAQNQPSAQPSLAATPASSSAGSPQLVSITDGVAYVGANGTVYALRTDNGTQLWHSTSNGAGISTPVVANGVVYIGTQEDKVLALRVSSGTLLWQFSDKTIALLLPSQLAGGVIYVTAVNDQQQGDVYALRASDGRHLWHYRTGASLGGATVIDGVVYVISQDGTLIALGTSDGQQLWQRALGGGNLGTMWQPPQSANGVLYVATTKMSAPTASTSSSGLFSQALANVSLLWGNFQAVPAERTVPHKEGLSTLYAIRVSDGAILWQFTMNNGKNGMVGWLSVEAGIIYATLMDFSTPDASKGHIYALQSTTGSVLWHYDDTTTAPSGAVLANGVIYASAYSQDRNDVVYALRASDGSMLWRHVIGQAVYNAPVLDGATVYVGTADGSVYALRADKGTVAWQYSPRA